MYKDGACENGEIVVELGPQDYAGEGLKAGICEMIDIGISTREETQEGIWPQVWTDPFNCDLAAPEDRMDTEDLTFPHLPVVWGDADGLLDPKSPVLWGGCDPSCERLSLEVREDFARGVGSPEICGDFDKFAGAGLDKICRDDLVSCGLYSPEICGDVQKPCEPGLDKIFEGESVICGVHSPEICGDIEKSFDAGSDKICEDELVICGLYSPEICGDIEDISPEIFEGIDSNYEECSIEVGAYDPKIVSLHSPEMGVNHQNTNDSLSPQTALVSKYNCLMEEVYHKGLEIPCTKRLPQDSPKCQAASGRSPVKRKKYSDSKLNCEPIVVLESLGRNVPKTVRVSDSTVISKGGLAQDKNSSVDSSRSNIAVDKSKDEAMEMEEDNIEECNKSQRIRNDNSRVSFNSTNIGERVLDERDSKRSEERIVKIPLLPINNGSDGEETEVIFDSRTDSDHSDTDTVTTSEIEILHSNHEEHEFKNTPSNENRKGNFVPKISSACVPTTTSRVVGRILEALVAPTIQSGHLEWVVKFKDNMNLDLVSAELIHEHFPQTVISYLERRLHFEPDISPSITVRLLQSYSKSRVDRSANK